MKRFLYAACLLMFTACGMGRNVADTAVTVIPVEAMYPRDTRAGVEELYAKYLCTRDERMAGCDFDGIGNADWDAFMDRIDEVLQGDVNFGCRYFFVEWGCGTGCQTGALIDAAACVIYPVPVASRGYEYAPDSTLLIVNPPSETGEGDRRIEYEYPAYYRWENGTFVLLHDTKNR